ncbi:ankyrin repeat-containing domain protein [Ilyonectria sp. MPI-CAGE-AT-0026]|nr:ankyrin repeat-containing domain protein [Ilyonectria sp. MPI-CAGE-AT-0026]
MGDPLSVISGVAGIIALATATAQGLVSLIQEIKDAPQDIRELGLELDSLSSVLQSTKQLCATNEIRINDATLIETVTGCVQHSSVIMEGLKTTLEPFVDGGNWRRRSMRAFNWTMRKGDIRTQRSRFRDGTARLTLAVSVLNGHLTGKGQDEIRNDIAVGYEKLSAQFQSPENGKRLRRRLESDLESVTAGHRRGSGSVITDADLPMRRFLEREDSYDVLEEPVLVDTLPLSSPDLSNEPLLIKAAKTGNRSLILQLLSTGSSTRERGSDGRTALHYAAIHDDGETARLLLERGAEVNAKDNTLDTPFKLATSGESINAQAAVVLVEKGCAMGDFPSRLIGAITAAEEPESLRPLISLIIKRRLNSGARGPFLLHQAIVMKDDACLRILLEEGLDPEQRDTYGIAPIMHALLHRRLTAVRILLDHSGNIDAYLPRYQPGDINIDQDYLKRLPSESMHGETPMSLSFHWYDINLTRFLLQAGANPNFRFPDFDQSTDLDTLTHAEGESLLNRCCAFRLLEYAKLLIKAGIDVNHKILSTGESPLYWSIVCGTPELLDILIENGVDVNLSLTSRMGNMSALHVAVQYEQIEMARVLIEHGADLRLKNSRNETPQEQAQRSGNDSLILLFEHVVQDTQEQKG